MAEIATLARPYAEAVFKIAQENKQYAEWSDRLAFLAQVIAAPEMQAVYANPKIDKETLQKILLDISGDVLNEESTNFVRLLIENHRLPLLPEISAQYEKLKADEEGYITVEVVSTYAVKTAQKTAITEALEKRFGREVRLEVSIDRSLLGGWLVRAGDKVIDLSVRGRLHTMAGELI